jgi:hypothetical protein
MIVAMNKANNKMKNKVRGAKDMFIFNYQFMNYNINPEDFYNAVAVEGYPFCIAQLEEDTFGYCHRHKPGFKSSEVIALDIDNEDPDNYWPYEDALLDPFVIKNALFIYTTPSHTRDKNRLRIVFKLPHTITDPGEVVKLNKALNYKFKGDTATVCCVQSFFGCTKSTSHFFGNTFDKEDLEKMVVEYEFEESDERKEIESSDIKNAKLTLDDIILILDYYFKDGKVDNYKWFLAVTILSAYCGLTPDVIKELLSKYFDELGDIDEKIKHADKYLKGKTIASLIYLAQQNGYQIPDHIDEQRKDKQFWDIKSNDDKKNPIYRCEYSYPLCLNFVKSNNFHIYCKNGERQIVRILNNLISEVNKYDLHQFLREFIDNTEKDYNLLALDKFDKTAKHLISSVIDSMPNDTELIDNKIIYDSKGKSYMYFKNGYLEMDTDMKLLDYDNLDGFIWKSSQKDHNIDITDNTSGDFEGFINKLATNRYENMLIENKDKIKTLRSSIGYLLHNFKNPSFPKCVVLTDEVISNSPQGGTGKSLFQKALSKIVSTVGISGTDFQNNKNYTYEDVKIDTRLINIDDCLKSFNFKELFSLTTSEFTVRKKYVSQVTIPFETSPKFCISSNTVINGYGSSFRRRMVEIEMSNYFSDSYTPVNEFGRNFFSEWDESEWNRYYLFMANCILYYLNNGVVEYEKVNIVEKKTKSAIGESLFEFFETYIVEDNFYTSKLLLEEYREMSNDDISPTKLTQSLKKYAEFKGLSLIDEYDKKLKSKVYILTNQNVKTLSEMKKKVSYEDNLNIL